MRIIFKCRWSSLLYHIQGWIILPLGSSSQCGSLCHVDYFSVWIISKCGQCFQCGSYEVSFCDNLFPSCRPWNMSLRTCMDWGLTQGFPKTRSRTQQESQVWTFLGLSWSQCLPAQPYQFCWCKSHWRQVTLKLETKNLSPQEKTDGHRCHQHRDLLLVSPQVKLVSPLQMHIYYTDEYTLGLLLSTWYLRGIMSRWNSTHLSQPSILCILILLVSMLHILMCVSWW